MDELDRLKIKELFDESIEPLGTQLGKVEKTVEALWHEVYGVQGNNGMKSALTDQAKCLKKMELKIAGWTVGLGVIVFVVEILSKLVF